MASKKRQIFLSFSMLGIASVITLLMYLNRPPAEIQEPEYQPVSVDVAVVVKESLRIEVQAQGTVSPLRESSILAEVNGRVVDVSTAFNVGGFVSKDEVLLRIDPRDYETNLLRASASVASAQSTLAQEKGRAQVALSEWDRLPKDSQRNHKAKDLYLRKPQLEQAKAQLQAANADLNTAQDNLERTIIRAPYDALIKAKHSDLGQFVAAGTRLADIFSIESAEIRLPIPQSKLAYMELPGLRGVPTGIDSETEPAAGSVIDLYTDVSGEIKHWTARLHRTEGVFDERSRALYAVARITDPYGLEDPAREPLRIGTFVNANIEGREITNIVRLPRYVLRAGNNLWVVDESNLLRNRQVTLLRTGGDSLYISAGLDEGDRVSLTSLDGSFDSSTVTIQSSTPTNMLDPDGRPTRKADPELNQATASATASVTASAKDSSGG